MLELLGAGHAEVRVAARHQGVVDIWALHADYARVLGRVDDFVFFARYSQLVDHLGNDERAVSLDDGLFW